MTIRQGARSKVRLVEIDGVRCIEKWYNDRKGTPAQKLAAECAFYRHYEGLEIIPELVNVREPNAIAVTWSEGERLIDLLKADALSRAAVDAISLDYGRKVAAFYEWAVPALSTVPSGGSYARVPGAVVRALSWIALNAVP